jgi:Ca2+-binding RTX toxin-like protein
MIEIPVTRLLTFALSVALVPLAGEGVARAAVTAQFANNTLTLTGDDSAETLTLGVSGPSVTHNLAGQGGFESSTDFDPGPAQVQIPSDGSVNLALHLGGGSDNVNVSVPAFAGAPVIDGGDGDDTLVGSARADTVDGGAGNDRITAFRGNDTINGGTGNDVIIWSNGDGSDIVDAGPGVDESVIVAATADDLMTVEQVGAAARFTRANSPFSLELRATERLSVSSAAGNDRFLAAPDVPLALAIDAGPGDDVITTGAGRDELIGGSGKDVLNGGAGDDRLLWREGDGSDVLNGDDGVDRVDAELSAGDDSLVLKPDGARVGFERSGPGPFESSIASSEVLALDALGGNDTLVAAAGVKLALIADGGAGDDKLMGTDAPDMLTGGTGDDRLEGGFGNDVVDGGDGRDALALRDGEADVGRGGAGTDSAVADALGVDTVNADVESVDRPPLPPEPAPLPPASPAALAAAPPSPAVAKRRIRMTFSAGWTVFDRGVKVESLTLKNLSSGTRVELSCPICRKRRTLTATGSSLRLRGLPSRVLRRGQKLVLTATKPGWIGHRIVLTVKPYGRTKRAIRQASSAPFRRADLCLPADSVKPQATC